MPDWRKSCSSLPAEMEGVLFQFACQTALVGTDTACIRTEIGQMEEADAHRSDSRIAGTA